jgi:antirestriction protein ArdC
MPPKREQFEGKIQERYYRISTDHVQMPPFESFKDAELYYFSAPRPVRQTNFAIITHEMKRRRRDEELARVRGR